MAGSVALWADSTYGALEQARALEIAGQLRFPLTSLTVVYGAGLRSKGDEPHVEREVAHTVIIEMGYNDAQTYSIEESGKAVKSMRKQKWFEMLDNDKRNKNLVQRVIFIAQPSYCQVRG